VKLRFDPPVDLVLTPAAAAKVFDENRRVIMRAVRQAKAALNEFKPKWILRTRGGDTIYHARSIVLKMQCDLRSEKYTVVDIFDGNRDGDIASFLPDTAVAKTAKWNGPGLVSPTLLLSEKVKAIVDRSSLPLRKQVCGAIEFLKDLLDYDLGWFQAGRISARYGNWTLIVEFQKPEDRFCLVDILFTPPWAPGGTPLAF
jgi:hypothetical protein